jgi:hypothetical protein
MLGGIGIGLVFGWLMGNLLAGSANRLRKWLASCTAVLVLAAWVVEKAGWLAAASLGGSVAVALILRWLWQRTLQRRLSYK